MSIDDRTSSRRTTRTPSMLGEGRRGEQMRRKGRGGEGKRRGGKEGEEREKR